MKRKFTLLIAALALLTMIVQPGRAWGQTTSTSSLIFTAACGGSGTADDGAVWTVTSDGTESNFDNNKGIHYGTSSAQVKYITLTTSDISGTITNIVVNASVASGVSAVLNVTVGGNDFGTQGQPTSTTPTDYTFTGSASGEIVVTHTKPAKAAKALYLKSIIVTYTTGGGSTTYTVTYNANGANSGDVPTDSNEYSSGEAATVLDNTGNLAKTGNTWSGWTRTIGDEPKTYAAGDTLIIKANTTLLAKWTANTHNVTMPAADTYGSYTASATENVLYGTTVTLTYTPAQGYEGYTATWSANNTPLAGNTFTMPDEDVTVSVEVAPYEQPTTVYIDMNYQWLGSTNGGNLSPNQLPVIKIDDNVTTTITDGTSTHPRGDTDYIRIYKGSTLSFAAPDGYNITQIVFTTGGNNTWNAPSVSSGTLSDKTWTGNAESVTFTLSGNCFISMAAINLGQSSLPTPTVTIDANGITNTNVFTGTDAGSLSASVTYEDTPVEGASVTWSGNNDAVATIDETTGAVTLVAAGSVTFTATFAGNASYNGASKNYDMTVTNFDPDAPGTQNNPYTVAQAIENTPTSGTTGDVYIHGIVSAFYNNNTTILDDNSHRYYISDDGSTSSQLLVYNGKGLNNVAFSNVDDLLIGDEITLVGKLKTYSNAPEVDGGNYIVSLVRPSAPVATPTFNPEAGVYTESQNVEISCETEGSSIYYTTDGTEPTNASTAYTGAISVTETTTIKAIAYVGEEYSSVATATYTIQAPLATMDEIMAAATAAGSTPTNVNINFNNWIVSGVGSDPKKRAFVTDGTKGFIIYNNDGGLTFERGDVLSGTKSCQVQLLNGAPCVKGLNANNFDITQTGQEPTVTTTTISALEAVNTGAVVDLGNLTWDGSKFVDNDNNSIYYYNTIYAGDVLTANTVYSVKGVYVQYSGNTPPKEIAPRDANDIVATPILATADVNIACDATEGAITYTLENPVSGGTLTAAVTAGNEGNWLTLSEEIGVNVPFTCTANTATTARTATVTLTYTYYTTETVTATAVVTQEAYVAPVASITVDPATVNAPAAETDGTLTVTYTDIATDLGASIFWYTDNTGTETTTEPEWISADIDDITLNVEYLIDANTGDARSAYFKVYGLDTNGDDVYSNLVTINQEALVVDYATLPFEYEGGELSDFNELTGTSYDLTDQSSYATGNAPYRIKFTKTGDYLQVKTDSQPDVVTIGVKMIGGASTSKITVKASTDGEEFDDGEELTISGAQNSIHELVTTRTFAADVRYIKMVFTKGSNVGVGPISITKAVPNIIVAETAITVDAEEHNGTLNVTYKMIDFTNEPEVVFYESDGVTTATYNHDWILTDINGDNNVDYMIGANTGAIRTAYFKVYGLDTSGNDVYSDLVTVTQGASVAITYHSNGTTTVVPVSTGEINLMTPDNIPNGYVYVGWATAAIDGTSTSATFFTTYDVTESIDLYAVFAISEYEQITSEPTAGTYILAAKPDANYRIFCGKNSNGDYGSGKTAVEITPTTVGDDVIVIAATINGYSMKHGDKYLGWTSGNTLAFSTEFIATDYEWTFAMDDNNNVDIITISDSNRKLKWNASSPRFACYTSAQTPVMLFKSVNVYCTSATMPSYEMMPIDGDGNLETDATIPAGAAYTLTSYVIIPDGVTLTVNGTLGNSNPDYLVIEDGGQLIVNNSIAATVEKTIQASGSWGSKDGGVDGWDLISSPIGTVNTAEVTNLTPAPVGTALQYDLYSYNEASKTWYNQQGTEHPFTQLMVGEGYLYSRKENADLGFAGEVSSASITKTLTYTEANGTLAGWNLVGNPYTHNITWANLEPTNVVTTGYYTLGYDGQWSAEPSTTTVIKPMQGFLVKANDSGAKIIFNNTASKSRANDDYIKFIVANSQYEDAAYAMFSENVGLDKINHRNADIPMLYIPQNDKNYAIATMDDNTQAFNLNFKAMTTGQYTLSFKAQGSYSYLHVIDRITGEDIDMLLDGEYTFIGSPRDNENRFIVKLNYNANIDELEAGDSFAYQYGNDIIVNGKGELQVFDVNGRMVMNTVINGKQTVNVPTTGLYIFRMIGESVKTQKIVVR